MRRDPSRYVVLAGLVAGGLVLFGLFMALLLTTPEPNPRAVPEGYQLEGR